MGKLQFPHLRLDLKGIKTWAQWLYPHKFAHNGIGGGSTPGVVQIEVGFVHNVPGFHRDRRATADHVVPTALGGCSEQFQRIVGIATLVQGIHQKLGTVHAASHAPTFDELQYFFLIGSRNQTKSQGIHVGVQGAVAGAIAVFDQTCVGVAKGRLKGLVNLLRFTLVLLCIR